MRLVLSLFLAIQILPAADITKELKEETRILRPTSEKYKLLKADFEKLSEKEAAPILDKLSDVQKKNFYILFSSSGNRQERLKSFLILLQNAKL